MPKKQFKTYTEQNNMKRAILKAGLANMTYRVEEVSEIGPRQRERLVFKPVFQCPLKQDAEYLLAHGWAAEYTGEKP